MASRAAATAAVRVRVRATPCTPVAHDEDRRACSRGRISLEAEASLRVRFAVAWREIGRIAEATQPKQSRCVQRRGEKRGEACGGRGGTMAAAAEHTWLREGVHGRRSGGRLIRRPAERDEED